MPFVPRPGPPAGAPPPTLQPSGPAPRPLPVGSPGGWTAPSPSGGGASPTRVRVIAAVIALAIPLVIYGWDFSHRMMHTGIYRDEFAGEVVSARPTVKAGLDWLMSGSSSRHRYTSTSSSHYHWYDSQNIGRYVLKIRGADNHTFEVSVSKREYDATMIPSYVVGHAGQVQHFHDRLEAVKRGAVPRQPGDPL